MDLLSSCGMCKLLVMISIDLSETSQKGTLEFQDNVRDNETKSENNFFCWNKVLSENILRLAVSVENSNLEKPPIESLKDACKVTKLS